MRIRRPLAVALAVLLAGPGFATAVPLPATLSGSVLSTAGVPMVSAELVLVNLDTGRLTTTPTNSRGQFEARVDPGVYSLVPRGARVVSGTRVVSALAGQRLAAALTVEPLATPAAMPAASLAVDHAPIGCFAADQFGEVSAAIRPAPSVADARVYFRSSWESEYHYVPMVPEVGRYLACIPRPRKDASPLSYYLEVQAKDGTIVRTPEASPLVVSSAAECPVERRMAVVCPCSLPVAVYGPGPVTPAGFGGALRGVVGGALAGGLPAIMTVGATAIGVMIIMREQPNASPSR